MATPIFIKISLLLKMSLTIKWECTWKKCKSTLTTRIRKLCCLKPSTLTILLLSVWCRTPRRVYYPLDMEYLFLKINILRHMRKIIWRQYPMPQLWVALCIRCYTLDKIFAFVIRMVSRYQSNLGPEHWMVVKHMLKYLLKNEKLYASV